jgi:hypothetical protein
MVINGGELRARWSLPLVRVNPGVAVVVALGGSRWFHFGVHWVDRGFLCPGEECPGCLSGPPRVMGYRVARFATSSRRGACLLELSALSVSRLSGLLAMEGLSEGDVCTVELSRSHVRSPVRAEPVAAVDPSMTALLADVHTLNAVALLYGLPHVGEQEDVDAWVDRVRPAARARLRLAVGRAG